MIGLGIFELIRFSGIMKILFFGKEVPQPYLSKGLIV